MLLVYIKNPGNVFITLKIFAEVENTCFPFISKNIFLLINCDLYTKIVTYVTKLSNYSMQNIFNR